MKGSLALVLSLLMFGAAQTPTRAIVEGLVLKTGTSDPVANADVALTPAVPAATATPALPVPIAAGANAIRVKTDSTGKFAFPDLAPGRYNVGVTLSGFIRPRRSGPTSITVTAGQQIKDVRLSLTQTGTISGRVIDENGEPRTVGVEVLVPGFRDGVRGLLIQGGNIKTDDRGEYRVPNLAPGKYVLRAMPTEGQVQFAPSYYPGVPTPEEATPVTVGPGAVVAQTNWQLLTKNLHMVKLKLTGMLPGNTTLYFFPMPKGTGKLAMGGRNTAFEQVGDTWISPPLASGAYEIGIVARPPLPPLGTILPTRGQWVGVSFEIQDRDVDLGTLAMNPGYVLNGHVTGQVAPNMRVRFAPVGFGTLPIDVISAPAPVAADGTFSLTEVKEQRFKVELQSLPVSSYIDSAIYGGSDVLRDGIFVDGDHGPLEITVATGGSIEGVATNAKDEPIASVRVVLVPAANQRGPAVRFPSALSGENGSFSFPGLRPGEYGVLAIEDNASPLDTFWEDPDFVKEYETRAKKVAVTRGVPSSVTVRTITVPGK
jgi:hypothetical protein